MGDNRQPPSRRRTTATRACTDTMAASTVRMPLTVEAKTLTRTEKRQKKHARVRTKVNGTPERPRLCVFRSNKHIYAQVIDDESQTTLAHATTLQSAVISQIEGNTMTIAAGETVGKEIAKQCLEKGIEKVCFDRAGYIYHGRIKAVAEGAREGGLDF